ncbi:GreA/GreB family elongation factor [Exiguobacterium qingdaonense]|uniref:GreA/GreB family elongation factor n=1 Tax=Exiguobacterium qingdaonense TaxID=2751251 RepID=UPI001BE6E837|nr:GreA/GreB family elongation factor [Exiguobacterium qingdaonense]
MKPKLTATGHDELTRKLAALKTARTDARERIRSARKFCDFREDVTYTEAVRHYERIEADIVHLERLLDDARVVESERSDVVTFGNQVTIREKNEGTETYRIVSEAEADIEFGSISMTSPLGRRLMGATVGQTIRVETPGGTVQIEVLNVEP